MSARGASRAVAGSSGVDGSIAVQPSRLLSKSGLAVRAHETIKLMILDQAIAPGARLGIDMLAVQLGISPTPVREALARLEGDGLAQRGSAGRYHAAPQLDLATFDQLYTVRLLLEPFAAGEAARHIDAAAAAALRARGEALRSAGTDGRSAAFASYIAADAAFHDAIAATSRNPLLREAIHHLHVHHRLGPLYRNRGVVDAAEAVEEHASIAAAVGAGAPERAEILMRRHIERSRRQLRPLLAAARSGARRQAGSGAPR